MDIFSRKRLTGWLIGILVLLNLLTLATLWYRETGRKTFPKHTGENQLRQKHEERFKTELGLDQKQVEQFNQKREDFFARLHPQKKKVHQLNEKIMREAFLANPDKKQIQTWSDEIAVIEARFPILLFNHLQELKQIARPDQQDKLQRFFKELLQHANPLRAPPRPPDRKRPGKRAP